jgi:hypothetical protein
VNLIPVRGLAPSLPGSARADRPAAARSALATRGHDGVMSYTELGLTAEVHGGNPSGAGMAWTLLRCVRSLARVPQVDHPSPLARSRALASSEACSASAVTTSSMYWQAVAGRCHGHGPARRGRAVAGPLQRHHGPPKQVSHAGVANPEHAALRPIKATHGSCGAQTQRALLASAIRASTEIVAETVKPPIRQLGAHGCARQMAARVPRPPGNGRPGARTVPGHLASAA